MAWWRRQGRQAEKPEREAVPAGVFQSDQWVEADLWAETDLRVGAHVPQPRRPAPEVRPVTLSRIGGALRRLGIRYLADEDGNLLAMWERHALLFALEGPEGEILVMRARAHGTVPPDWCERAYAAANEWNHTRRFLKSYVGDATERGQLPLYAEMQVPLVPGTHDALLDELVDCATAVAGSWVDWLHEDGGIL